MGAHGSDGCAVIYEYNPQKPDVRPASDFFNKNSIVLV